MERPVAANAHGETYRRMANRSDGEISLIVDSYQVRLARMGERWKITAMTLKVFYQESGAKISG